MANTRGVSHCLRGDYSIYCYVMSLPQRREVSLASNSHCYNRLNYSISSTHYNPHPLCEERRIDIRDRSEGSPHQNKSRSTQFKCYTQGYGQRSDCNYCWHCFRSAICWWHTNLGLHANTRHARHASQYGVEYVGHEQERQQIQAVYLSLCSRSLRMPSLPLPLLPSPRA
jgi:hypothetical protein